MPEPTRETVNMEITVLRLRRDDLYARIISIQQDIGDAEAGRQEYRDYQHRTHQLYVLMHSDVLATIQAIERRYPERVTTGPDMSPSAGDTKDEPKDGTEQDSPLPTWIRARSVRWSRFYVGEEPQWTRWHLVRDDSDRTVCGFEIVTNGVDKPQYGEPGRVTDHSDDDTCGKCRRFIKARKY